MSREEITKMTREEITKRSEIQFQLINLNVIAASALAGLAYSSPGKLEALLVIPFLSFALCAHWIHLGITIRLGDWKPPLDPDWWQVISRSTHALSVLSAFVGIPLLALLAYHPSPNSPFSVFEIVGFVLCIFSILLYCTWFYVQYGLNPPKQGQKPVETTTRRDTDSDEDKTLINH